MALLHLVDHANAFGPPGSATGRSTSWDLQTSTGHPTLAGSAVPAGSVATPGAGANPAGSASAKAGPEVAVVRIKDSAYSPATLTVKVGETVQFVKDDVTPHTVTASDKSFDSGNMNQNAAWSHVFAKAGTYRYICTFHANMKGSIIVR